MLAFLVGWGVFWLVLWFIITLVLLSDYKNIINNHGDDGVIGFSGFMLIISIVYLIAVGVGSLFT